MLKLGELKERKRKEGSEDDDREPDGGTPPYLPAKQGIYHFIGFLQIYALAIWKKKPHSLESIVEI
ncbi:hypothetical protein Ddye_016285 [Dipteronia dyeriana]|uniref:Uncharacterized protein n=1 Tax=Dipteronia dyeriana TaxID=168575 RepID=A0AAD9WZE7_9ROSI|nr:hypothetical protein Ddye_016285 [Dipteronia dyeriana]